MGTNSHADEQMRPAVPVGPTADTTSHAEELTRPAVPVGPTADTTSHAEEPMRPAVPVGPTADATSLAQEHSRPIAGGPASAAADPDKKKASKQVSTAAPAATPQVPPSSFLESKTNGAPTNIAAEKASNGTTNRPPGSRAKIPRPRLPCLCGKVRVRD